ncbi:MAG: HAD-IB family hydrolase [Candidatus Acidiferrales bacterium]
MSAPENSAAGVGAFFDVDGTLVPGPSLEWRFIGFLMARGEISAAQVGGWLGEFLANLPRDAHRAIEANKRYLGGIRESLAGEWENAAGTGFSRGLDSLPYFDEAVRQLAWHCAQGHRVFLVSGTLAPLARAVAHALLDLFGVEIEVCATELAVGREFPRIWTGRIAGEHMSGSAKLRAVKALAARYGLDLARSYAYGDRLADVPMLAAVGHPVAVNPERGLARFARRRGWGICRWKLSDVSAGSAAARQAVAKAVR